MRRDRKFRQRVFLENLVKNKGLIFQTCKASGIGVKSYYDWLKTDPDFAEKVEQANKEVFDLVDRAGETYLSKLTADANYKRYQKKVELQTKFFNNGVSEVKI